MLIEFHSSDRMLGIKALGIYEKGIDAATAACEKVYVPTLELQDAKASSEEAMSWVAETLDNMGVGEVTEHELSHRLAQTLRTATSVYIGQLTKLGEKQADLLVPIEDTNVLISQLTSLADRLNGQTEIHSVLGDSKDTTTVSINGSEPISLNEFNRRLDTALTRVGRAAQTAANKATH
jgi:sarcosine oxidase gamma subunit